MAWPHGEGHLDLAEEALGRSFPSAGSRDRLCMLEQLGAERPDPAEFDFGALARRLYGPAAVALKRGSSWFCCASLAKYSRTPI